MVRFRAYPCYNPGIPAPPARQHRGSRSFGVGPRSAAPYPKRGVADRRRLRSRLLPYVAALLLAATFVSIVAAFLSANQSAAVRSATDKFTQGPAVATNLAGSLSQANQAANLTFARATYGGDPASVRAAVAVSGRDGTIRTIVRDAGNRVMAF